jgi:uncharacterized repeat protein (TIGR03803 family)
MSYWKKVFLGCALFAAMAISSSAQTFTTLATLTSAQGSAPFSALTQGRDGSLYGTAAAGGAHSQGTVFRVSPVGAVHVLHNFCAQANCTDGAYPVMIVLATDGNLYGTTYYGGVICSATALDGCGTIFRITPGGAFTVLHSFNGTEGEIPTWLIEASDRNFYGTAFASLVSGGTVFKMSPNGTLSVLHSFEGLDGMYPQGVVQGTDGNLYGTTYGGGKNDPEWCQPYSGCGTVFKVTTSGAFTSLHSFDAADGSILYAPVVQAKDGTFYGTTFYGGGEDGAEDGTIFSITTKGHFESVYQFTGIAATSTTGLVPASDGNLYGTIGQEGACGGGHIYSISLSGVFTPYANCEFGGPNNVAQFTNGMFYGEDGPLIYSFDNGLGPFVTFVLPAGRAGRTAQILGQGLTGTTSVTFNGIAATEFSVVSDTYMTAVVPAGATTGAVVVATPAGNLTSNVSFRVSR